ncbi:Arginine ABC transporter permease protein ArtM [Raoultella terrigena]|uniref:Arginine ABC transporter permease protein ArtM n=1 Tax=Raoultella terrigena TaxID=577 RepID=A0A4U9DGM2_RAOTE|nr:Arginine ABC transporter permease protein ArtM [Raoultella terrigena]
MSKKDTLAILLPYAFKRALSSYSHEVVLVFKSTSLAYTITLMEVMGHSQLLYGRTYDVMVFGAAGIGVPDRQRPADAAHASGGAQGAGI